MSSITWKAKQKESTAHVLLTARRSRATKEARLGLQDVLMNLYVCTKRTSVRTLGLVNSRPSGSYKEKRKSNSTEKTNKQTKKSSVSVWNVLSGRKSCHGGGGGSALTRIKGCIRTVLRQSKPAFGSEISSSGLYKGIAKGARRNCT